MQRTPVLPKGDFLRVVALPVHLERLPEADREAFVEAVDARCAKPITLHHVQLNVSARRALLGVRPPASPLAKSKRSATRDWDASTYDRVSDPQFKWGLEVLDRLPLNGDETVLDAGCGSGRLTRELINRLPNGHVVAVDGSASMVELARKALPEAEVFQSDLSELEVDEPVDAIFSNAVFHWIKDHDELFRRLHAALAPGGRLWRNAAATATSTASGRWPTRYLRSRRSTSTSATGPAPGTTPRPRTPRLARGGRLHRRRHRAREEDADPARAEELPHHGRAGPAPGPAARGASRAYVDAVLAGSPDPLIILDYIRLNIDARKPA